MRYFVLVFVLFFSFCKPRIPKEYRKMQKKVERRERRQERERINTPSSLDTVYFRWTPVTDTVFLGVPKIPK